MYKKHRSKKEYSEGLKIMSSEPSSQVSRSSHSLEQQETEQKEREGQKER